MRPPIVSSRQTSLIRSEDPGSFTAALSQPCPPVCDPRSGNIPLTLRREMSLLDLGQSTNQQYLVQRFFRHMVVCPVPDHSSGSRHLRPFRSRRISRFAGLFATLPVPLPAILLIIDNSIRLVGLLCGVRRMDFGYVRFLFCCV